MATAPNLLCAALMFIFWLFGYVTYRPTIKRESKEPFPGKQAAAFGFMEARRGISGIVLNSLATAAYMVLESLLGMRTAMAMSICCSIIRCVFGAILLEPRESSHLPVMIRLKLLTSVLCYFNQSIYCAPVGDAKTPIGIQLLPRRSLRLSATPRPSGTLAQGVVINRFNVVTS